jgi:ABC-type dipeptide/oligopeptide/nickel transport system ATPase component
MDLTDFINSYDMGKQAPPNGKWAPKHFFRGAMIGPSGCGKTSCLLSMLLNTDPDTKIYFDKIYIYAKDIHEPAYDALRDVLKHTENVLRDEFQEMGDPKGPDWKLYEMSDKLTDVPQVKDLDDKICNLMIFDDFARDKEKEQNIIEQHYKMGRKRKCSYFYLSQSYYDVPGFIRKQLTHLLIWKLRNTRDIRDVIGEHSVGYDDKVMRKIYAAAVEPRYSFFFIDKVNPDMPIRQGFKNVPVFE